MKKPGRFRVTTKAQQKSSSPGCPWQGRAGRNFPPSGNGGTSARARHDGRRAFPEPARERGANPFFNAKTQRREGRGALHHLRCRREVRLVRDELDFFRFAESSRLCVFALKNGFAPRSRAGPVGAVRHPGGRRDLRSRGLGGSQRGPGLRRETGSAGMRAVRCSPAKAGVQLGRRLGPGLRRETGSVGAVVPPLPDGEFRPARPCHGHPGLDDFCAFVSLTRKRPGFYLKSRRAPLRPRPRG